MSVVITSSKSFLLHRLSTLSSIQSITDGFCVLLGGGGGAVVVMLAGQVLGSAVFFVWK